MGNLAPISTALILLAQKQSVKRHFEAINQKWYVVELGFLTHSVSMKNAAAFSNSLSFLT